MSQYLKQYLLISALLFLTGCGFNPFGWLSPDKDDEKPAELVDFDEEVRLRRLWNVNIGSGQGDKYNRLKPAIEGDVIYAASNNGTVTALNLDNGDRQWLARLEYDITGGVSADNGMVLLGTENSSVIALDAETGDILWETEVSSEVLSAPATDGEVVVVQSVDGRLSGHDADDGSQIWIYENTVPALSLRGTSSPIIIEDFVIAAFGNGTVVSLAVDNGTLRWEERVAIPTGVSEIDRLVDIDGELLVTDNGQLLAPSYQGYFSAIDIVTGQTRWRIEDSSFNGASEGFGNIYLSDERGHIKAYRIGQDDLVWENDALDLRRPGAPVSFNNYVAVGDFEGYVHLMSQVDGRFVGRTRVDRDGIRAPMLASGNTLYVFGNSGELTALSVR